MNKVTDAIKEHGGYIVHKPSKAGGIGLVYRGNDGDEPVFGYDNGMIFTDIDMARDVCAELGWGYKVRDVRSITPDEFIEMCAMAAIFDD